MENDSQDKQHQATAKRIAELGRKGKVMRSRDLSSGLVIIIAIVQLLLISTSIKIRFIENFKLSYSSIGTILDKHDNFNSVVSTIVLESFNILIPLFCITVVAVIASPFLFGGWNFTL